MSSENPSPNDRSPQVKRIVLPEPGQASDARHSSAPRWMEGAAWLVAPLLLLAVGGGLWLLRAGPAGLFTGLLVLVCAVPVVWGLVSIFFPASPDRRCPACRELKLEAIQDGQLRGLRCAGCGYLDPDASAWMFAEEGDSPLEPLVLESRRETPPSSPPRSDAGGIA